MRPHGGGRAIRALIASLAVLLPAGVLSAVSAWEPGSTAIAAGGVATASVGMEGVPDEPVTTTTTIPASATSTPRPEVPTSLRPTATTTRPPAATTTTRPREPTSTLPTTTVATTPLPSKWSATNAQLSVSVRMEPAAPVAGQPVTFTLTVAPGVGCCLAALIGFGDEGENPATSPGDHAIAASQACGSQSPGSGVKAHTYAQPGAYRAVLRVVGLECLPEPDQNGVATGWMVAVEVPMCVGVGPGAEARECAP